MKPPWEKLNLIPVSSAGKCFAGRPRSRSVKYQTGFGFRAAECLRELWSLWFSSRGHFTAIIRRTQQSTVSLACERQHLSLLQEFFNITRYWGRIALSLYIHLGTCVLHNTCANSVDVYKDKYELAWDIMQLIEIFVCSTTLRLMKDYSRNYIYNYLCKYVY